MTNEKASVIIGNIPVYGDECYSIAEYQDAKTMAIKALEQEPRKITYEDVKGYCKPRCLTIIDNELLYELTHPKIKALEQEPKWIPVSERLPKKSGKYWCTFGGTNLTGTDFYTTKDDAEMDFVEPEEHVGWQSQNVIAWMPLPEPYEPQESEKV